MNGKKSGNGRDGIILSRVKWKRQFAFEAYGVKIGIRTNDKSLIKECRESLGFIFPTGWREIDFGECEHSFSVYSSKSKNQNGSIYKNDDLIITKSLNGSWIEILEPQLRVTVAEFAGDFVFLHAGAVTYNDKAIIIPGKSFSGKTTLVAELSRRGFKYYSDEYAVIDRRGLLHPFPKKLSMRGIVDDYTQVEMDVEELGGEKGKKPVNIKMVLVTKYKKNAGFKLEQISTGKGIIESIANSISIRHNPEMVLQVLSLITADAEIIKTERGEVGKFADNFQAYLEQTGF